MCALVVQVVIDFLQMFPLSYSLTSVVCLIITWQPVFFFCMDIKNVFSKKSVSTKGCKAGVA